MGINEQPLGSRELVAVLDALREGIQVIDREWRYVYLNAEAAVHARVPREELLGRTMADCYAGIEVTPMYAALRRCMDQGVGTAMQNEFTYADGQQRTFELRIQPCGVGLVVLSIDVTERQKLETQSRHAQKMEAVGRLAGSVAHDFNNLLSVILSYSAMLLADLKPSDPLRGDIEAIQKAGDRAAALTRQLSAFSRQQTVSPRAVNLNEIVQECEKMLRRLIGADVELVILYERTERDTANVKVDPGQIEQVVLNLALNARDAMPQGGKLTIETKQVMLEDAYSTAHFGVTPGSHMMLAVSDTGVGMDQETQSKIFEPFFTTKEKGSGTGLGLSTVFGIVQQNGGNIWVYSEPGGGSTFKVYFPRVDEADGAVADPPPSTNLNGTETILLVEDQDEVRHVAQQVLRRYGYHVIEARNAGEAWLTCERHPRTIHLMVTDVVMPQMSGRELAERVSKIRPAMKVLYMSGYTDNAVLHHGILDSGIAYLQKPLVPNVLARRVREILDSPPAASAPPK